VPVASTLASRALGLALLARERAGVGLLIPRCASVHTFGMRFPLALLFIDADGRVIRRVSPVGPRRFVSERGARAVLELPVKAAARGL
jgi:uncharacterized membrane protein (UPF0127 family)